MAKSKPQPQPQPQPQPKPKHLKISGRVVDGLAVEKDTVYWDRELPGFGVRVYATGGKMYVAQTRAGGRSRRVTIGRHGVISAGEARKRAALAIGRLKSGRSPTLTAENTVAMGPTVAEVAKRYLVEHVAVRLKPNTVRGVRVDLEKHIVPAFGKVAFSALDRERVAALHASLYRTPSAANRMVDTLSAMFSVAQTWGIVPEGVNPCPGIGKYGTRRRERFLTEAEFERLGRTLGEMESEGGVRPGAAAAIRLLMLTGCRCNEILRLRWDEVDFERNELRLADSKTGKRTVPLSPAAARVLSARPRVAGNPWVIPGKIDGRPLRNVDRSWRKVRARAGLEGVRLHDLRHSFASRALALGESLPMIGRLLGHARVRTTARYAHLTERSVRESAARIAANIGADLSC